MWCKHLVFFCCYRQKFVKMDNVSRREINNNKKVQSYGSLLSENSSLKKELYLEKMRKEALVAETKIQSRVISQLKTLLQTQTKPLCCLGHRWCKIDHQKYNYRSSQPEKDLVERKKVKVL